MLSQSLSSYFLSLFPVEAGEPEAVEGAALLQAVLHHVEHLQHRRRLLLRRRPYHEAHRVHHTHRIHAGKEPTELKFTTFSFSSHHYWVRL